MQLSSEARTNGFAITESPDRDWRHDAMNRILRCASEDGSPIHLLFEILNEHAPDVSTHTFYQDRTDVRRTLPRLCEIRPVVQSPVEHTDDTADFIEPRPVYGWWELTDHETGAVLNLFAIPNLNDSGYFVLWGDDGETCKSFITRLHKEMNAVHHRCRRFLGTWKDDPELDEEASKVSWSDIVLPAEQIADIRGTIDQFFTSKEVFRTIGFPWRRGILLIGPPGTGKTMVCKAAAAAHPEVPFLYVGDVRHNGSLQQIFKHARESAPCILAFEDMDGLVSDANRTYFLNELDGFRNNDGILIIASSNYPKRIDEALLKRPSRFDRVYHIGLPAKAERAEYCRRFLNKLPNLVPGFDIEKLSDNVAQFTEGFTPAFLKEAFLAAMLQLAHEGHTTLDERYANAVGEQVEALRKYLKKAKNPDDMADMLASSGDESMGFRRGGNSRRFGDPFDD
ncbi:MAG: ATP-binding protein [Armatimonadetes bacterium]|nr:ATP-binding protein [Armatimonadota bacterium]